MPNTTPEELVEILKGLGVAKTPREHYAQQYAEQLKERHDETHPEMAEVALKMTAHPEPSRITDERLFQAPTHDEGETQIVARKPHFIHLHPKHLLQLLLARQFRIPKVDVQMRWHHEAGGEEFEFRDDDYVIVRWTEEWHATPEEMASRSGYLTDEEFAERYEERVEGIAQAVASRATEEDLDFVAGTSEED